MKRRRSFNFMWILLIHLKLMWPSEFTSHTNGEIIKTAMFNAWCRYSFGTLLNPIKAVNIASQRQEEVLCCSGSEGSNRENPNETRRNAIFQISAIMQVKWCNIIVQHWKRPHHLHNHLPPPTPRDSWIGWSRIISFLLWEPNALCAIYPWMD